jgi:hypothetical protein
MLYRMRVNAAIAKMGVKLGQPTQLRKDLLKVGEIVGNSPQEVAIYIVSQVPPDDRGGFDPAPIRTWIRRGKVNPVASEMKTAFTALGLSGLTA